MTNTKDRGAAWNVGDTTALIAGLLSFAQFDLGGHLLATDLFLLGVLFFTANQSTRPLRKGHAATLLILCSIWLLAQVITDVVRGSEPIDFLRGWAKIFFTITNFSALYLLFLKRASRILVYAFGLAIGQLVGFYVHPDPWAADDVWKWGFGPTITSLIIIAASMLIDRGRKTVAMLVIGIASLANFYFNFRSEALFSFVTLFAVFLVAASNRAQKRRSSEVYTLVGLLFSALVFQQGYSYAAGSGLLGPVAQEKYEKQSSGDMGTILGGRAEALASIQAIADSPIIGHGSWARDFKYVDILKDAYLTHGYGNYYTNDDLIPSHSHVFGAWVESGVAGAAVWVWVLWIALRGTLTALSANRQNGVLTIFCGLNLAWDVMFSPYGTGRTVVTPMYIILMIFVLKPHRPHVSSKVSNVRNPSRSFLETSTPTSAHLRPVLTRTKPTWL